jgi:hypothetical protein
LFYYYNNSVNIKTNPFLSKPEKNVNIFPHSRLILNISSGAQSLVWAGLACKYLILSYFLKAEGWPGFPREISRRRPVWGLFPLWG